MEISKIEAAKFQLDCAAELYFCDKDEISIHTLTCAAYQILRDVMKDRGTQYDSLTDRIIGGYTDNGTRKLAIKRLNEAENFFKHADKDPDGTIELDPEITHFYLFDAICCYRKITGNYSFYTLAFYCWLIFTKKEFFEKQLGEFTKTIVGIQTNKHMQSKQAFLNAFPEVYKKFLTN